MMSAGIERLGPALAMLAIADVPLGLRALDALAKEAPVEIFAAGTIQNGDYLVAFAGEVEPVELAFARARAVAGDWLRDAVFLPHAERRILPALAAGKVHFPAPGDTLGVVQTGSPPTLVAAVDAALKGALVELVELRVGDGLAGRAIASLWGETHDVQAAMALCDRAILRGLAEGGSTTVIPNAEPAVGRALATGTRFFKEWRG